MPQKQGDLKLILTLPLRVSNGGLFVSRGEGAHPERVISSFELIFVHHGVLKLFEASRQFTVEAGETLLLWPGRRHGGIGPYPEDLSFYWLHFVLESYSEAKQLHTKPMELDLPQYQRVARPDHLTNLFRRFLDDQEMHKSESSTADLLALLMLCEVVASQTDEGSRVGAAAQLASRAYTVIRTEFHKTLSTDHLAKKLHSNPDYLGRVFRKHYGMTLTEALHQRRLKHARKLLLDTDRNIDRVASECGFNDTGYFRRIFRRSEGMTPYAFRKLYSRMHINTE
jgi:AraC-like DNA-binding protein